MQISQKNIDCSQLRLIIQKALDQHPAQLTNVLMNSLQNKKMDTETLVLSMVETHIIPLAYNDMHTTVQSTIGKLLGVMAKNKEDIDIIKCDAENLQCEL